MTILTNAQVLTGSTFGDTTFANYDAGSGSNRILFVFVAPEGSGPQTTISGVTYNGVSMTADTQFQIYTTQNLRLFYLVNPASGANNIVVDMAANEQRLNLIVGYVSGFSAVSNLARDVATGSSTTPSVTCTSANGETVLALLVSDQNASQSLTPADSAVLELGSNGTYWWNGAMSEASSGASVTINGTLSQGGSRWGMAAASLTPAGGGSSSGAAAHYYRQL